MCIVLNCMSLLLPEVILEVWFLKWATFPPLSIYSFLKSLISCLNSLRRAENRVRGHKKICMQAPIQSFPGCFLRAIFFTSLHFSFLIRNIKGLDKVTQPAFTFHDITFCQLYQECIAGVSSFPACCCLTYERMSWLSKGLLIPWGQNLYHILCSWNHIKYIFFKFHSTISPVDDQKQFPNEWMHPGKPWFILQPIKCYPF